MASQNVLALYKLGEAHEHKIWAEAQDALNERLLQEGLADGTIKPLQTCNTITLHIPEQEPIALKIEPEEKGYLTPVIKMNLLRSKIRDLNCLNGKFQLLNADGIPLSEPIMDGSEIHVKLRAKKVISEKVLARSTQISVELSSFNIFGITDSCDNSSNDSNADDSDDAVVTEV